MLKIAITGSRGFVGRALMKGLESLKVETIEIDLELGYDIADMNTLSNIEYFDVLIHLAAKSFVPDSFDNPVDFYRTNVMGTLNALELCRKYNAKMIYTSSYVYGAPDYLPIDENHPLRAYNPYAQSKLIGEDLCKAYNRDFSIPIIILRPFNIYGKGQAESFLIPIILEQAAKGKVLLKDSRPKRDFIYIEDVVDAYVKSIEYSISGVETFNIGSGKSISIKKLTSLISKYNNKPFEVEFSEEKRRNEVLDTIANISKAKKMLRWNPKYPIEKGIEALLKK